MQKNEGMDFEDVRKRVRRIESREKEGKFKNSGLKHNLTNSLINQAERRERGAGTEIMRELNHKQSKWI